jgi:TolB-like protein/Tfp pilus assembly protein PilF/predicted Ser/Thr protein kinase
MTLSPGSKLGPYEILSSIGSGGMGEVWKARDTRLGRIVAIKKVKEQHSERFKQEARSIAALNHPNICQIHDIGDNYLVLEYVEGKPPSSPLPEQEAVKLAIQIATALEEAHQHGIIHRDLKPSNIMVTEKGSVKLLDFGLAKLYEQDQSTSSLPTEDFPATQAGAILGTVAYMSPEQAQGQPADARSDIFSFGLVLYEMLSGRRAFSGETPMAVGAALIKEEPSAIQASAPLQEVVRRCLSKQPSGRYQTMLEVKSALEQVFAKEATSSVAESPPSIAVLPFVNMSGDKEQEYFSDGLAEEIINALTQIQDLKVIARTSAFAFKGKDQDVTKIAEALRVRNILEGSVRKAGNRIRVTAQLIDASDGSHLWSQRYDREITDVFEIQDEISQAIANKLRVHLEGEGSFIKSYTKNVKAYSLYLKGQYHFYRLETTRSKEYLEQATEKDPNYSLAWYGLAKVYWFLGFTYNMPHKIAHAKSNQAAQKALDLDEKLPEAHSMLGALRAIEFDWKEAEREFNIALTLDPTSQEVLINYTWFFLMPLRRFDEGIIAMKEVLEKDPLSLIAHNTLGFFYYFIKEWDFAIEHWKNTLELDPQYYSAHNFLGLTYAQKGMKEEIIHECETALRAKRNESIGWVGLAFARIGLTDKAQKLLNELKEQSSKKDVPHLDFALLHLGLSQIELCFDRLEKAIIEHDDRIYIILHDIISDQFRSHPRYKALLRKMNLEA